jgi:hypothetical protein
VGFFLFLGLTLAFIIAIAIAHALLATTKLPHVELRKLANINHQLIAILVSLATSHHSVFAYSHFHRSVARNYSPFVSILF